MPQKWILDAESLAEFLKHLNNGHPFPELKKGGLLQQHFLEVAKRADELIWWARVMTLDAISYRSIPFRVGAAGLFWTGKDYKICLGANFKPYKGPPGNNPKRCAEHMVLDEAMAKGYLYMPAMAITGIPQTDSRSGLKTDTLQCCDICREELIESDLVDEHSLIITVHRYKRIKEVHTARELNARHDAACACHKN